MAALIELLSGSARAHVEPVAAGRSRSDQADYLARAEVDDPHDLPMLLARLTGGTSGQAIDRLAALGDDPRLSAHLVHLLEHPPFASRSTQAR